MTDEQRTRISELAAAVSERRQQLYWRGHTNVARFTVEEYCAFDVQTALLQTELMELEAKLAREQKAVAEAV